MSLAFRRPHVRDVEVALDTLERMELAAEHNPVKTLTSLRVGNIEVETKVPERPAEPNAVECVLVKSKSKDGAAFELRMMNGNRVVQVVRGSIELLDDMLRVVEATRRGAVAQYGAGSTRPATLKEWGTSTSARPRKVRCR